MAPTKELSTLNVKILSLPIEIATNRKSILREFHDLTSAMVSPANGESPVVRFRVVQKRRYTHLEREGRTVYRLGPDEDYSLCPLLIDMIRTSCYEHVRDYILLHAASVTKNGRAILLPGKADSGKTTLTIGLMNHGYKYLTDEISAIHHETIEIAPFQRPIYASGWTRPLRQWVSKDFKVYHYREKDDTIQRWQCLVPQGEAVMPKGARWKIDWIIFPRYTPKGKVILKPLDPAKAVMALMQRGWNQRLFPDRGLKIYTGLVRRAQCYTLEMGDLEEACKLIEGLVGKSA